MDCMLISELPDTHSLLSNWTDTKTFGKRKYWFQQEDQTSYFKMRKHTFGDVGMNSWEQDLAADLDGSCSLSNLSVDLGPNTFSNSEALLSLPSLSVFKQELLSPFNGNDNMGEKSGQLSPSQEKQNYEGVNDYGSAIEGCTAVPDDPSASPPTVHSPVHQQIPPTSYSPGLEDCRFQYVLAAATSIATKINEETLTYLNQGQSYEIKLKKLGDLSECRGKILKSVVRLCFHERRLQYTEREQLLAWEATHPGDSILQVDLPLSYGIVDLAHHAGNAVDFLWDPTKEVGVYIKVNCISTEFTPKKHGGEKGVPFRIQVDTYLAGDVSRKIHSASCQVKVFKLKGADRKHKQDREKILKRPLSEQDKYQSSCDCTILTDVPISEEEPLPPPAGLNMDLAHKLRLVNPIAKDELPSLPHYPHSPSDLAPHVPNLPNGTSVLSTWTAEETAAWLTAERYGAHLATLGSYSGADLLRLTREQLVALLGLGEGLRLHNALRAPAPPPVKTVYASVDGRTHRPVYLAAPTASHLATRLSAVFSLPAPSCLLVAGPGGIRLQATDDLVAHMTDHSVFDLQISPGDCLQLLLIPTNNN